MIQKCIFKKNASIDLVFCFNLHSKLFLLVDNFLNNHDTNSLFIDFYYIFFFSRPKFVLALKKANVHAGVELCVSIFEKVEKKQTLCVYACLEIAHSPIGKKKCPFQKLPLHNNFVLGVTPFVIVDAESLNCLFFFGTVGSADDVAAAIFFIKKLFCSCMCFVVFVEKKFQVVI